MRRHASLGVALMLAACRPAPSVAPEGEDADGPVEVEREAGDGVYVEQEPGVHAPDQRVYPAQPERCAACPPGGCVGLDCDGDGIGDQADMCPSVAEDLDGYEDLDGCPDGDNDGDGVPDVDDACPLQAGVVDGVHDDRGCP